MRGLCILEYLIINTIISLDAAGFLIASILVLAMTGNISRTREAARLPLLPWL